MEHSVVQGALEARLSRGLKQAAEWLESHDVWMQGAEKRMEETERRMAESDARMTRAEAAIAEAGDKLNRLIAFMARRNELPEL